MVYTTYLSLTLIMKSVFQILSMIFLLSVQSFAGSHQHKLPGRDNDDAVINSEDFTPNTSDEMESQDTDSSSSLEKDISFLEQMRCSGGFLFSGSTNCGRKTYTPDVDGVITSSSEVDELSDSDDYTKALPKHTLSPERVAQINAQLPLPRYPDGSEPDDENTEDRTSDHLSSSSQAPTEPTSIVRCAEAHTNLHGEPFRLQLVVERIFPGMPMYEVISMFGRQRTVICMQNCAILQLYQQNVRLWQELCIRRRQVANLFQEVQEAHENEDRLEEDNDKLKRLNAGPLVTIKRFQTENALLRREISEYIRQISELKVEIFNLKMANRHLGKILSRFRRVMSSMPNMNSRSKCPARSKARPRGPRKIFYPELEAHQNKSVTSKKEPE